MSRVQSNSEQTWVGCTSTCARCTVLIERLGLGIRWDREPRCYSVLREVPEGRGRRRQKAELHKLFLRFRMAGRQGERVTLAVLIDLLDAIHRLEGDKKGKLREKDRELIDLVRIFAVVKVLLLKIESILWELKNEDEDDMPKPKPR